ncbi:glutaminase A [Alteribacillus sp. HJP-4]|uniref:glutaminase A n=1 Tax=Alteribacillus sp. HJP-4 TaxID=2775394 RepID=UPI0035CD1BFE
MAIVMEEHELRQLVQSCRFAARNGKIPDYIPALKKADPGLFGCVVCNGEKTITAGEVEEPFTLQSVSKIISLALALMDKGEEAVFQKVGMEPSGDPFYTLQALEEGRPSRPMNPMINAGALAVTSLLAGNSTEEKLGRLLAFVHELTENTSINICEETAQSELEHADLNLALCHYMKSHGVVHGNMEELLEVYIKQCALRVTCRDLAKIGSVIGRNGNDPATGRSIIPPRIARIVKTFMVTCGMYNASGEFAIKAGIPTKSGISGALVSALPDGTGIGIVSPPLDEKGNSAGGVKLLETLAERRKLSIF